MRIALRINAKFIFPRILMILLIALIFFYGF